MNTDLISYYRDRAKEYEKIYLKPERQENLISATALLQHLFAGKKVLEIACGTGFWTEKISVSAESVYATDINLEVIEIAKQKNYPSGNVRLAVKNLYDLDNNEKFDAVFGGFIWSHIPIKDLSRFIDKAHKHVEKDGLVVFMDNSYVEGSNHPITETDEDGNTFQTRKLADGSTHRVLKNFPTSDFLAGVIAEKGKDLSFVQLDYFWILSYKSVS